MTMKLSWMGHPIILGWEEKPGERLTFPPGRVGLVGENRQRQKQMRGFFPFDKLRVRMTRSKAGRLKLC